MHCFSPFCLCVRYCTVPRLCTECIAGLRWHHEDMTSQRQCLSPPPPRTVSHHTNPTISTPHRPLGSESSEPPMSVNFEQCRPSRIIFHHVNDPLRDLCRCGERWRRLLGAGGHCVLAAIMPFATFICETRYQSNGIQPAQPLLPRWASMRTNQIAHYRSRR
jgi:hypothetical protein